MSAPRSWITTGQGVRVRITGIYPFNPNLPPREEGIHTQVAGHMICAKNVVDAHQEDTSMSGRKM